MSNKITIPAARIAFEHVFKKDNFDRYSLTALVPKNSPHLAKLNKIIETVVKDKWGDKAQSTLKAIKAGNKLFISDGDAKADYDGFEGNMAISAANTVRPTAFARDKSPVTEDDGVIYSGCYADVAIEVWAQDNQWGKRINATLRGVRFVKDGDAFAGGGTPASDDDFDDLAVEDEEEADFV